AAMRDLIRQDLHEALTLALSPEALTELAEAFPESASELEAHEWWEGIVERWVADSADLSSHVNVTRLNTGRQRLEMHFVGPEPARLSSGSVLSASGVRLGVDAAVASSSIRMEAAIAQ